MADKTITASEALVAWDAGESVWTVAMGGIGLGYEQAIQIMAFEFLRFMLANPPSDWGSFVEDAKKWEEYRASIENAAKDTISRIQPSGAQFGAAMNMAACFARKGYAAGLASAGDDRHILCSRTFQAEAA